MPILFGHHPHASGRKIGVVAPRVLRGLGLFFVENLAPTPPAKIRAVALIDGFNLYHAIDDCPHFRGYKWLNPVKLCERLLITPAKEELHCVTFFTAVPKWNNGKQVRHLNLLGIYGDLGVRVIMGKFTETKAHCRLCNQEYDTHQEKMTDINITLEMLRIGHEDVADRIYLVTGDNDQAPGVSRFRALYPKKEIVAVIPPYRKAKSLTDAANHKMTISEAFLKSSVLDDPHVCADKRSYVKPATWVNGPPPAANWRPREQTTKRCH